MPTLAQEQLKAQLRQWRTRPRWDEERVFAIRTDLDYQGQPDLELEGLKLRVATCQSDLEARERLGELGGGDGEGLVLLVRSGHGTIGEDIRCQFAGRQLQSLDPREVLKEIYHATSVDPRIAGSPVLLEALVNRGVNGGAGAAPGGALDIDFAWSVLLRMPEMADHRPDLTDLLAWSRTPSKWASIEALDEKLKPQFFLWAAERAGRVLTRDQIMEAVRGRELDAFDRSIDVHMGRIRAAIEVDAKNPKRILTVRGVGYVFARQQD